MLHNSSGQTDESNAKVKDLAEESSPEVPTPNRQQVHGLDEEYNYTKTQTSCTTRDSDIDWLIDWRGQYINSNSVYHIGLQYTSSRSTCLKTPIFNLWFPAYSF